MKKRKVKLFASIASLGLVVAVMGVGVWAATQQAVKVSSQVSFTATSVAADIKLSVNNAVAPTGASTDEQAKYAKGAQYDIVKEATLSVEMKGTTGVEANQYKKSDLYKHLLYSEAVPTEITEDGDNKGKYNTGAEIAYGADRAQARRIAYFNNDTAKTLYDNRVYLNLQDKDEDGYLNVGAKVVYEFTIEALESSAPIYYHATANLFDTWFYTADDGTEYDIRDIFEVQVFDVKKSTPVAGQQPTVTVNDQVNGIKPSSNATWNGTTTQAGATVTDDTEAANPTAILTNWTAGAPESTQDTKAIQPGETRTIQVVYTVKDIDGASDLYQGISYTMKSLQLGDIYIKLANSNANLGNIPDYAENMTDAGFDKKVAWTTSKDEKPEGEDVTGENNNQGGENNNQGDENGGNNEQEPGQEG